MDTEINKKLDLLGFQKNLNKQFLEIFKNKNNINPNNLVESNQLGLGEKVLGYRFFFPLKDLKNISSDNRLESVALTKSWITGFNQVRGDTFTIVDFHRIIEYIISDVMPSEKRPLTYDSNVLYLKDQTEAKLGLVIDTLSLEYTADLVPLFKYKNIDKKYFWNLENNINYSELVKKENISEQELSVLSLLYKISNESKVYTFQDIKDETNKSTSMEKLLWAVIGDVYIDKSGKNPVFVIDLQRLTKFLMNVSPF